MEQRRRRRPWRMRRSSARSNLPMRSSLSVPSALIRRCSRRLTRAWRRERATWDACEIYSRYSWRGCRRWVRTRSSGAQHGAARTPRLDHSSAQHASAHHGALPPAPHRCSPDASDKELAAAYRDAARRKHPDRGGDKVAFQKLQQAYEEVTKARKAAGKSSGRGGGSGGGGGGGGGGGAGRAGGGGAGAGGGEGAGEAGEGGGEGDRRKTRRERKEARRAARAAAKADREDADAAVAAEEKHQAAKSAGAAEAGAESGAGECKPDSDGDEADDEADDVTGTKQTSVASEEEAVVGEETTAEENLDGSTAKAKARGLSPEEDYEDEGKENAATNASTKPKGADAAGAHDDATPGLETEGDGVKSEGDGVKSEGEDVSEGEADDATEAIRAAQEQLRLQREARSRRREERREGLVEGDSDDEAAEAEEGELDEGEILSPKSAEAAAAAQREARAALAATDDLVEEMPCEEMCNVAEQVR